MHSSTTSRAVVLIIEDQPVLRMAAVDMVEEVGFETLETRGADEAVQLLESRDDIRVVFSDIDLSNGADGLKLAHAIRDRWPPVGLIITSGRHRPEAVRLPVRGVFFSQPYQQERVTEAMRRLTA